MTDKPLLTPSQFKRLCLMVAGGDYSANATVKAKYHLQDHQKEMLNALMMVAKTKLFPTVTYETPTGIQDRERVAEAG